MQLRRIVIGVDFSDTSLLALETAFSFSLESGGIFYLVHVLEHLPMDMAVASVPHEGDELVKEALGKLGSLVPVNLQEGVTTEQVVLTGPVETCLSEFAVEKNADIIIVGTHGRKGLSRALLGSTAEHLLRETPCKVLVAKHKATHQGAQNLLPH